jgi:hypothetical protein
VGVAVQIETTELRDVLDPEDPASEANYSGWDLAIRSGARAYVARRYEDEPALVTFLTADGDGWRGPIPYEDADFRAAVLAVAELPGVTEVHVLTSNETGLAEAVDLSRAAWG